MTQRVQDLARLIATTFDDKQAQDIQIIDISGLSILADCFVVASGTNPIQVRTMCDEVKDVLAQAGANCSRIDGYAAGRWIVMDASDILVHIFHQEERAFYNLERLWNDGTNTVSFEELFASAQSEGK